MKRYDIVLIGNDMFSFYGRIVSKVDNEHFMVADCGKTFTSRHISELEVKNEYKGFMSDIYYSWRKSDLFYNNKEKYFNKLYEGRDEDGYPITKKEFVRMPKLRTLKQMCAQYNKKVWKKNRKILTQNKYLEQKEI
jgi:hypothetical protein